MPNTLSSLLFGILVCTTAFADGHTYSMEKWTFEKQVAQSDLVIVGQVERVGIRDDNPKYDIELADVSILLTLKGVSEGNIRVLYKGAIAEDNNPICCLVNHQYIFLLKRRSDGVFYTVNGRFGVYEIPTKTEVEGVPEGI